MNTVAAAASRRSYTAAEAAKALGISNNSVYAHVKAGHIKAIRLGKKIIILQEEIDRLLREGAPSATAAADPLA
jgi:excisionase family DNA binding protein